jgi:peptide-methionine (S)-S-oxide reductase
VTSSARLAGSKGAARSAALILCAVAGLRLASAAWQATPASPDRTPGAASAVFAGGCFWSMEHVFDELPGVTSVTVGYAGGTAKNPSYELVELGVTGHAEAVRVVYDPGVIDYRALLDAYWRNIDPTDGGGQFCDQGSQYRPVIFVGDETQKQLAEASKQALEDSRRFKRIAAKIVPASTFWRAEDRHQHFYKTHAFEYRLYRIGCGRDARLQALWGRAPS